MLSMRRSTTEAERTAAALRAAPLIKQAVAEMQLLAHEKRKALLKELMKLQHAEPKDAVAANREVELINDEIQATRARMKLLEEKLSQAVGRSLAVAARRDRAIADLELSLLASADARIDSTVDYLDELRDAARTSGVDHARVSAARTRLAELRAEVWGWRTGDCGSPDAAVPLRRVIEQAKAAVAGLDCRDCEVPDLEA